MLRIAVAFLAGSALLHVLPVLPDFNPWAACIAILFVLALVLRSPVMTLFLLGFVITWTSASARLAHDLPVALEGTDIVVIGHVASLPDLTDADPQFDFDVDIAPVGVPPRVRLAWYDSVEQPAAGERWQLVVRLKRRSGFANPGGFDYEAQLLRQGIGASGYIRDDQRNVRLAGASSDYPVLRLRAWLAARITTALGVHPMLGIVQGLAVGATGAMTSDQWRVLAATGTTHLMAISGLHITMIAALAAWLGGRIVIWPAAQKLRLTAMQGQAVFGVLAAIVYAALAGMSVPTQRTLVMLLIVFMVRASRREFSVSNALGLSLIAVLIVDPFAPLAVGAWLSFGAVIAILLASAGRRAPGGKIREFARTQVAVTLGLLPVLLGAFGSVSVVSPLVNAIAVPLFSLLIVPSVLLGTAAAALSPYLGAYVLWLPVKLLDSAWPILEWCARSSFALWHFPQFPLAVHAALFIGALLLIFPGISATRIAAAVLCVPALTWRPETPEFGEARLTVLDVGQGLASVIQTHSHVLVYDTGPKFRSGRDTGELVVLPYLYSQGTRSIDALMISHGDLDHAGGMKSILKGLPVRRLLVGPSVTVPFHIGP
ncbi:MAG: DNA internalization-related competence protein ComEC/Rec2 [Povalibacter sp.]